MGTIGYNQQLPNTDSALITAASDTLLSEVAAINATGTARTISLTVVRGNGQTETFASALNVPANSALRVIDMSKMAYGALLLRTGDVLRGSCSAATAVTLLAYS